MSSKRHQQTDKFSDSERKKAEARIAELYEQALKNKDPEVDQAGPG